MSRFPAAFITLYVPILLVLLSSSAHAELSTDFYSKKCSNISNIVLEVLKPVIETNPRMAASLLRLHFHDCFVNGCDGSILLDNNDTTKSEKEAKPNNNSATGYEIINNVKKALEKKCPQVVSCADIIAIVARESVCLLGGPEWKVKFGRLDSFSASQADANNGIPSPFFNLDQLVNRFEQLSLSKEDLVALSGSHSIGKARCTNFRTRIYNETETIDESFANEAKKNCTLSSSDDDKLEGLDYQTPYEFDNAYYKNIMNKKGLLHSDQELVNKTDVGKYKNIIKLVKEFSVNQTAFYNAFASAMVKMGDIGPLTGDNGEVRNDCRKRNSK